MPNYRATNATPPELRWAGGQEGLEDRLVVSFLGRENLETI
jgi:hypothetical protein